MSMLVLDSSVTMTWLFQDQKTAYTVAVLEAIAVGVAVVPGLWGLEVANVLATSERKGVITASQREEFLSLVESLPVQVEQINPKDAWREVLAVARKHRLSAYDAAYLELAKRFALPIASLDEALLAAAKREGAAVFGDKNAG